MPSSTKFIVNCEEVLRMLAANEWVNQFGVVEDKTTPEKSILECCAPVMTDTASCPIHCIVDQVLKIVRNIFTPQLDKLLDSQGKIRTGQQGPDVKELLRMVYFDIVQAKKAATAAKRAAKTKGAATKASSSSSSGDDEDTENPPGKQGQDQSPDEDEEAVKLQAAKDRCHPDELYLYFVFGPSILGGSNNIYFLKDAAAMQEAVAKSGGGGRAKHRADRGQDMEGEARACKVAKAQEILASKLLSTPTSFSTPSPVAAGAATKSWALPEQRTQLDKRWQQHDRLLGKMVLCPIFAGWVPLLPSSVSLL